MYWIFLSMLFLSLLILFMFFFLSANMKWDKIIFSSFECGFTSYFFSRFSYSVHYFMVALIFLFLDLELCVVMPLFIDFSSSLALTLIALIFLLVLFFGLLVEWFKDKLIWLS